MFSPPHSFRKRVVFVELPLFFFWPTSQTGEGIRGSRGNVPRAPASWVAYSPSRNTGKVHAGLARSLGVTKRPCPGATGDAQATFNLPRSYIFFLRVCVCVCVRGCVWVCVYVCICVQFIRALPTCRKTCFAYMLCIRAIDRKSTRLNSSHT